MFRSTRVGLRRWFSRGTEGLIRPVVKRSVIARAKINRSALKFERLEDRQLLANVVGTSGNDAFSLTYSLTAGTVAITIATNGGAETNLGTFPINESVTVNGLAGEDSVKVRLINGSFLTDVSSSGILINGSSLTLSNTESLLLKGGTGNDTYRFDADSPLGLITLDETAGGIDTLDFSPTTSHAISLNMSVPTKQVVNSNLSLNPKSASTFENAVGGTRSDTIIGNALPNILTGNAGNDTLTGNGSDDQLEGGAGLDSLLGGPGDDMYVFATASTAERDSLTEFANAGNDTLHFGGVATSVSLNLGSTALQSVHANRTLLLNSATAFENAIGGSGNDVLTGNSRVNSLLGLAGHDILMGGAGNDSLTGGPGNDIYVFGTASASEADSLTELPGGGIDLLTFDSLTTPVNLNLGSAANQTVHVNRVLSLNSSVNFENATGGSAGDFLTGNSVANTLRGSSGHDTLTGRAGNDTLIGGAGNDYYVFATASTPEADTVTENENGGNDTIDFSQLTTDVTFGLFPSGIQNVHVNRTLSLSAENTVENSFGGSGNDSLYGSPLDNIISGNAGNDIVSGADGNDQLLGGAGRDFLIGGTGADILNGGSGDDILIGGIITPVINRDSIRTKWISGDAYGTRVFKLRSQGTTAETLRRLVNVGDDGAIDKLTGGSDMDWFFARAGSDVLTDRLLPEFIDSI
jgi:Ca2+-binding RTX toxin-like protein